MSQRTSKPSVSLAIKLKADYLINRFCGISTGFSPFRRDVRYIKRIRTHFGSKKGFGSYPLDRVWAVPGYLGYENLHYYSYIDRSRHFRAGSGGFVEYVTYEKERSACQTK